MWGFVRLALRTSAMKPSLELQLTHSTQHITSALVAFFRAWGGGGGEGGFYLAVLSAAASIPPGITEADGPETPKHLSNNKAPQFQGFRVGMFPRSANSPS